VFFIVPPSDNLYTHRQANFPKWKLRYEGRKRHLRLCSILA